MQGLRDTLEEKEPVVTSLQRDAKQAKEMGVKLVKVADSRDSPLTEDVDAKKYTDDVESIVKRWQVCKNFVDER